MIRLVQYIYDFSLNALQQELNDGVYGQMRSCWWMQSGLVREVLHG